MDNYDEQEYTKEFDFGLWKKIFQYVKKYKKDAISLCILMILLALVDAVFPVATKYAIDNFIEKKDLSSILPFSIVYIFLIISSAVIIYYFIATAGKIETGVVYEIRKKGFQKLQELSFSYYDNTAVGWIMARMTSDAQKVGDVVAWGIVDMIWAIAIIIIVIIITFFLNVKLAIINICIFPLLAVACFYFQKKILKSQREVRKINSKITGAFNEGITGAKTTKTLTREEGNFQEFKVLTSDMKNASIKSAILSSLFLPVVLSMGSVAVALVLWLGGNDVILNKISFGTLSVFISYGLQIFEPIQQIARVFSEIQSAQASAERTFSLIETESEITDRPDVVEKYGDSQNPKKETWPTIKGKITFENVSFSYKTGEKVLDEFSLEVKEGEKIALVGETGSGKSTIVNLICRFYEPTKGQIKIDDVDYRERPQIWLHSNLGYVLQTPHLFSGTIMENIRYGKLDATDDEVIEAAKAVNAYDFIVKMEEGFQSQVGETGSKLSAGERQLVSFARAILSNPKIFILDEATSSIDTETEQVIQKALENILLGRTSFIIAHRLSTIRSCHRILVIEDGKILESGSHKELLKQKGHYYNLYTNQFKKEAENKLLNL